MTKKIHTRYTDFLKEHLSDPDVASAYLNEALLDPDRRVFLVALKDVINARGEAISTLAKKAHVSRQNFYRMLSQQGNPRWDNITSLMYAIGLQVQVFHRK